MANGIKERLSHKLENDRERETNTEKGVGWGAGGRQREHFHPKHKSNISDSMGGMQQPPVWGAARRLSSQMFHIHPDKCISLKPTRSLCKHHLKARVKDKKKNFYPVSRNPNPPDPSEIVRKQPLGSKSLFFCFR